MNYRYFCPLSLLLMLLPAPLLMSLEMRIIESVCLLAAWDDSSGLPAVVANREIDRDRDRVCVSETLFCTGPPAPQDHSGCKEFARR